MKNLLKVLACLLAFALLAYLILFDYPNMKEARIPQGAENSSATAPENTAQGENTGTGQESSGVSKAAEADSLKMQEQLAALRAQCAPAKIALCFDQIDESAYEELYPLLSEYGVVGTLVLRDGQLPGDNGKITTAACLELSRDGWTFAVGGDSDIDMTTDPETAAAALGEYLDGYLSRIWVRIAVKADTFIFAEGEYQEAFDEVLEERGFNKILYVPDGSTQVSSTDSLEKIPYYPISQSAGIENIVQGAENYGAVALVTRLVEAELQDETLDCTVTGYELLLQALADDGLTEVTALSEMSSSTEDEAKARIELMEQIRALEDALG